MSEAVLTGTLRKAGTKGAARQLRAKGDAPGAVYGINGTVLFSVSTKQLLKLLEDRTKARRIITTKFDGDKLERKVLIKSLDFHPISDKILHLDLWEVDLKKPLKVRVEIELTGSAVGVKEQGGTLLVARNNVTVKCLPEDIPTSFTVPVDDLEVGAIISVKDVVTDDRYETLEDAELTLASISIPKAEGDDDSPEAAAEGAAEGEAAAPVA